MNLKNFLKSIFFLFILISVFYSFNVDAANTLRDKLDNIDGNNTHIQKIVKDGGMNTSTNLPTLVSSIIKLVLGLFGVIALIFIVRAGVMWMGSKGDSAKIRDARKIMASGAIGLALIATSYASADFIIDQISLSVNKGYTNIEGAPDYSGGGTDNCSASCDSAVTYDTVWNGNGCLSNSQSGGVVSSTYDDRCGVSGNVLGTDVKDIKTWDCVCQGKPSTSCFKCKVNK